MGTIYQLSKRIIKKAADDKSTALLFNIKMQKWLLNYQYLVPNWCIIELFNCSSRLYTISLVNDLLEKLRPFSISCF